MRSYNGHSVAIVRTGGLSINLDTQMVTLDGQQIYLTRLEYSILELPLTADEFGRPRLECPF